MKKSLVAVASSLLALATLDAVWLSSTLKSFYAPHLAPLLAQTPQYGAAAVFYPLYALALAHLVVLPAAKSGEGGKKVFLSGALLGLAAYGAYDLTNQASLKDWPLIVSVVDMAWGAFLTGTASLVSLSLTRKFS